MVRCAQSSATTSGAPREVTIMDPTTEIASKFTVGDYDKLRPRLDPTNPQAEGAWPEAIKVLRRRIEERFLSPVDQLIGGSSPTPSVPGFAILALDCLLIDTIQSFREGRVTTGEVSPARSFKDFLKNSSRFRDFNSEDREKFFHYVRNGLLHNGETRGDWKVRADTATMLTRADSGTRTINRTLFHRAIVEEFEEYCALLGTGQTAVREKFLRRMDAICGRELVPLEYYFAYGSNLLDREIKTTAPRAADDSVAYLPGWRLVFNKHSNSRGGDAASIGKCAAQMVWGYVYRISADDKAQLAAREGGYRPVTVTVLQVKDPADCEKCEPLKVFTFVAEETCAAGCGVPDAYLKIVLEGAKLRGLPPDYVRGIEEAASRLHAPTGGERGEP